VQLSALVVNDPPTVAWRASAGSITPGGQYIAPSRPVRGGSVVISATSPKGARDRATIAIGPVQVARAAPALATGPAAGPQPLINALVSPAGASSFTAQALSPPEAVLFAGKLVMTTTAREA